MAFTHWSFIYLGVGSEDPSVDRAVIESGGLTTTIVAVPQGEAAVAVAVELVEDGAQAIELCGGFDSVSVGEVVRAVDGRAPIGVVRYGPESIPALSQLFGASEG